MMSADSNQQPPLTIDELKTKFKSARETIDQQKLVPVNEMTKFVEFLEWVNRDPVGTLYDQPELKRFFFEEFAGGLAKRLSLIRTIDDSFAHVVYRLCQLLNEIYIKEVVQRDNSDMADAMRYLLDTTAPIHQQLFQTAHVQDLSQSIIEQSAANNLSEEEKAWRKELLVGSFVDCVKIDQDYNLKVWAKGQVTDIKNDLLEITFMNDTTKMNRTVYWYSSELEKFDSKSEGDEWRMNLKVGDTIDSQDSTRIWYGSTVRDTCTRQDPENPLGPEYPILHVGFRTYQPDGNKEDLNKQKFFGWSESFDEWIPAYSPRVQKFNTHAKSFEDSQQQLGNVYEETLDDQMDVLNYARQKILAVARKRCKSALLIEMINTQGDQGVFKTLIDKMMDETNDQMSIEMICYQVDSLAKCCQVFNKGFLNEYLPTLILAIKRKLLTSGDAAFRNVRKDRIDGLVSNLINALLPRLMSFKQRDQEKNTILLEIGCHLLTLNFLERRIDGAKFIQEVSKNCVTMGFQSSTDQVINSSIRQQQIQFVQTMIKEIKERRVFHQIFSRERGHTQLVLRADELLKLFITQGALSEPELELVWAAGKIDENTQLEIYKLFNELSSRLKLQDINFIIDKLDSVPLSKVQLVQVQLIHEIAKRAQSGECSYGHRAVEYMWKLAIPNENIDKVLINTAALAYTDIIKNWENTYKIRYIENIIEALKSQKDGYLCIKMLYIVFRDFIGTPKQTSPDQNGVSDSMEVDSTSRDRFENRSTFIEYIEKEYNLMTSFFLNFQHYMLKARAALRQKVLADPNLVIREMSDKVLTDRFPHNDQMTERFSFLKAISQGSSVKLNQHQLTMLWNDMVALSMFPSDSDLFFKFFKEICDLQSQGYLIVELDELVAFFRQQILANGDEILPKITSEGFSAIHSFFILLNESQKKIQRLYTYSTTAASTGTYPPQKITSYSNTTGGQYHQYSFTENKNTDTSTAPEDIEFHIHVAPWDLEGLQAIWNIVLDCSDFIVVVKATQFLIKLYTSVTFELEPRLAEFENSFMQHCFLAINQLKEIIESRAEKPKEEFEQVQKPYHQFSSFTSTVTQRMLPREEKKIIKYLELAKELIRHSEKEGTRGVKSHAALFRGAFLDCVQVCNSIKTGLKYKSKHELAIYSNTTVWELRKIIGEHCARASYKEDGSYVSEKPCHPYSVRVFRAVGCMDIKELENGKTLGELRFKHNEIVTAYRKGLLSSLSVPLLNIHGTDLSERAKFVFSEWFTQCSEPSNPNDPHSFRIMNHEGCQNFIRSATDEDISITDNQLLNMFKLYDYNDDGYIELGGFLNFWRDSIKSKEELVRNNLLTYGYRHDLRRNPADGIDDDYFQVRPSKEAMPRFKIASEQFYFDLLFDIMHKTEHEVAQAAWSLVRTASTNPILYRKVLALDSDEGFKWEDVFDTQNIHKMLYALQIVEALLEECSLIGDFSEIERLPTEEELLKRDWVKRFMLLGGFQEILTIFQKSLTILSNKSADNLTKFEKNFLEQMLKMIKIFILAAYAVDEDQDSVFDVIQLVKQVSNQSATNHDETDNNKNSDSKTEVEADSQYTTPAKQVKGKFVQRLQNKTVQFNTDNQEITQELLFGGDNGQEDPDKKGNSSDANASKNAETYQAPDDTKQRFSALAKIMRQCGLGGDILQNINFKDLQIEVVEVICILLGKRELGIDDISIIENALSLWVATLVKNGDLINDFYRFTRDAGNVYYMPIKTAEDFIAQGVHTYKNIKIREEFSSSIMCLSQKVKNTEGQKPILYFIDLLRRNYPSEDTFYISRDCKQFFDLLTGLIADYINQISKNGNNEVIDQSQVLQYSEIDIIDILSEVIDKLKKHPTKETKGCILEDKTQIGYFTMIEKLITLLKPYDTQKRLNLVMKDKEFADEIYFRHLFYKPGTAQSLNDSKSITKESRAAAYSLLLKVIEVLEPKALAEFLENDVWELIKEMDRPKKWKFVPSDGQKGSQGGNFVGLVNLGCICYMNSMLQQFFMVPQFRYQLLKAVDESALDLKEHKGYLIDDSLLRQLQIMFSNLELSEKQAYYPLGFTFAFKDLEGNPTNTALQQDAQEFINFFFGRLEDLLKPTTQKHLLEGIFGGKLCSQSKCPECGFMSNNLESYYNLSMQVKDRPSLDVSLKKMIENTSISDFKCENCKQKVEIERRQLIAEPPNVLIINLQRIIFNFDTFANDKINTRFEFPHILDLKEYSYKHIMKIEGHSDEVLSDVNVRHLMDIADDDYVYKLVGVTIHRGTAEHGHYYSLINTKRGHLEEDETKADWQRTDRDPWKVFDDETVKHFNFGELQNDAFGGNGSSGGQGFDSDMQAYLFQSGTSNSYGQNAYMLVYEKMKKKPIKEVVLPVKKVEVDEEMTQEDHEEKKSEQVDKEALECANTATSRDAPATAEELVDPSNGEKYKLIPYRKVEPFVPEWVKRMIMVENNQFLIDRYIFHESFFNLIKGIMRHIANNVVTTQHQYKIDYLQWFYKVKSQSIQIAGKVMFDMLTYFNINTQMSDITNSLQTIFTFCDSHYSLTRDPSLLLEFINDWYTEEDFKHFLNIMFDCPDKTSRFYTGKLTGILINKVYQVYQDCVTQGVQPNDKLEELKKAADTIVIQIIKNLKSQECMKNWMKLEQYLKLIYDIGTGGKLQADLMLNEFPIVAYLLDVVLAQCNSKTSTKLKNFESLVALICFFVRHSMTPVMRDERHKWDGVTVKPPTTLIGYDLTANTDLPEKYPISDSHLDYLIECEIVSMALKEGVQTEQLGKMVAHLCYKNQKFSKRVSKMLLHGISRNDYEKIKSYLDVVVEVALVKDQCQRSRLEWMFGFGSLYSHTAHSSITNDESEVLTKVGVKAVHSLSDESFTFKSSLIQDTVDDSLLHLLWRYKGRMDNYTVNCVYSLLVLITQDNDVATFFSELPGPTYCLARYTDWFRPYLERQLADAKKGYSGTYSTEKEEIIVKCLSLMEQYEAFLITKDNVNKKDEFVIRTIKDLQEDMTPILPEDKLAMDIDYDEGEENVKNLIQDSVKREEIGQSGVVTQHANAVNGETEKPVIRTNPQPYIIVDCVSERIISQQDFGNVILQISALGCFYTESLPTGESNKAIPDNLFKKSTIANLPLRNAGHVKVANAEQNMQANCINNYFQSSGIVSSTGVKGNTTPKKSYKSAMNYGDEEECMDNNDQEKVSFVIKDDDSQWEKINSENLVGGDTDMQADEIQQQDGSQYVKLNGNEPAYQIKVVEEGDENELASNNFHSALDTNMASEAHHSSNVQVDEANNNTNLEQISWPNQIDYCEDLAYRIQIINYRDCQIKCSINFADDSNGQPINLFYPRGGFKGLLLAKSNKTMLVLHKLKPDMNDNFGEELNKLITHFKFKEVVKEGGVRQQPVSKNVQVRAVQNDPVFLKNLENFINTPNSTGELAGKREANNSTDAIDQNNSINSIDSEEDRDKYNQVLFDPDNAVEIPPAKTTQEKFTPPKNNEDDHQDWYDQIGEEKNCQVCTFLNPLYASSCDACGTPF